MKFKLKRGLIVLFLVLYLPIIFAPPPSTKTVDGTVYSSVGVQAGSGADVMITDLDSSAEVSTTTGGPPGYPGVYSAVISSTSSDQMEVFAWNATHYGNSSGLMGSTRVTLDVMMNKSRNPEANVTIVIPDDGTIYELGDDFNLTALIQVLGADGVDCNATLNFSGPQVEFVSDTEKHNLGPISRLSSTTTVWNLTTTQEGALNLTVESYCSNSDVNLESLHIDSISISVGDILPPVVNIISPKNNSRVNNPAVFYYNVTDASAILNCSLTVNSVILDTNFNPTKDVTLNFTQTILTKTNEWSIDCTDNSTLKQKTLKGLYNLTINSVPSIESLAVTDPINLLAASNQSVSCNGTINDLDGISDVTYVNATLYSSLVGIGDATNKSTLYRNSSCLIYNQAATSADFICGFDLTHYSLNSSWVCDVVILDSINATNQSTDTTTVNQLIAIDVSPQLIDYGDLEITQISAEESLSVTNEGNVNLDLELFGFGVSEPDSIAMSCGLGEIDLSDEKFSLNSGLAFASMTGLGSSAAPNNVNFNLIPSTEAGESLKNSYWRLRISEGTSGTCNGKIVFTGVLG